jgi:hypothetical protein
MSRPISARDASRYGISIGGAGEAMQPQPGRKSRNLPAPGAGHTARMPTSTVRSAGPIVVAVLSGVLHLVVGYFYAVSGLVVPGYALIPLWLWWIVQAFVLFRLAFRGSWWTPAVPVVAAATWLAVLFGGGALLGWQP